MDDNKIEIDGQCVNQTDLNLNSEELSLPSPPPPTTTTAIATATLTSNNLNEDLHTIENKRLELDNIQKDLDDLMTRINSFIADSQESDGNSEIEEDVINEHEKEDGPSEKELQLNAYAASESLINQLYLTDSSKPPEIDWDTVGPILQKHVSDLQRLHNLNQMTHAVVKRIRNVTQINETLLKEADDKLHGIP